MFAFRYLTIFVAVATCLEEEEDVGTSLLQLNAASQAKHDLVSTFYDPHDEAFHGVEDDASEGGEHVPSTVFDAAQSFGAAISDNPSKKQIAEAYVVMDAIFREYLMESYPICGYKLSSHHSAVGDYLENDLLGDSLDPSQHAEHENPIHNFLLFLFAALGLGLFTLHFLSRYLPTVPYTSLLFVEGLLMGIAHATYEENEKNSAFYKSITMWENIDPHLLFFTLLPVLVFGDAMNFNVHIFNKCFGQIMILACPGVVLGTVLVAMFAMYVLPYGWDINVSMAFGAILSATDPVAVVALFKSLGVSPKLTMLISGESVCNDGTAVVIFTLFFKITKGSTFTVRKTLEFLLQMTAIGPLFGLVVGGFVVFWIGLARRKHAEEDNIIQVMLTVLLAYCAFYFAETVFVTSGVLTCVSAAMLMANIGLARINHIHTVEVVWHVFEYIANTLIFILAGLIVGGIIVQRQDVITQQDYLWLILLYLALLVIRLIVVFSCFPLLRVMGAGMTWQEAVVSTWSGLRGAVGLSLAIIMDINPVIDRTKSTRIMFFVGGIAALTLLINGSTTRFLLQYLNIGMTSQLKEQMLKDVKTRMESRIRKELEDLSTTSRFDGADVAAVQEALLPKEEELPTIEELSEPVLDPERLRFLREIFLQVVRQAYHENVQDGTLSGTSLCVQLLISSVDEALEQDKINVGLADWEVLQHKLANHQSYWQVSDIILKLWPFSFGRDAIKQNSAVHSDQNSAIALLNFMHAHSEAQVRVLKFFGSTDDADSPEEKQIIAESRMQVRKASEVLEVLPQKQVALTKSKMLAAKLLEAEANAVLHMDELGILTKRDSAHMLAEVHTLSSKSTDVIEEHAAKAATKLRQ
jgi:NhaP-type Na+/H+ or K+/H+ antiporter